MVAQRWGRRRRRWRRWVTEGEEVAAAAEPDKMWCPYLTRCLWGRRNVPFSHLLWFFSNYLHTFTLPGFPLLQGLGLHIFS